MQNLDALRRARRHGSAEIAGRLRERIALSSVETVDDGHGGWTEVETPLVPAVVFGEVESLQGTERMAALALEVSVLWLVTIRYHAGVTAGTRMRWMGHVLEVNGPPVEIVRRELMQCYCAERGGVTPP